MFSFVEGKSRLKFGGDLFAKCLLMHLARELHQRWK